MYLFALIISIISGEIGFSLDSITETQWIILLPTFSASATSQARGPVESGVQDSMVAECRALCVLRVPL